MIANGAAPRRFWQTEGGLKIPSHDARS